MKAFQWIRRSGYWVFQRCLFYARPRKAPGARVVNVIYKPDAIGDFLLASGTIQKLVEHTDDPWVLLCSPEVHPLARFYFPGLEQKVVHGSNSRNRLDGLKKIFSIRGYTRTISVKKLVCLKHARSGMDHVLLNWLHPDEGYGHRNVPIHPPCPASYRRFSFSDASIYPSHPEHNLPIEVAANHRLLCAATSTAYALKDVRPFLPLPAPLLESPYLAVFPVTRSRLRNYPLEQLAESVIAFLRKRPGFPVNIVGTQSELPHLQAFQAMLQNEVDATITLPPCILDAAHVIQKAALVLSMDSAPAHIAVCLNTPGVFLLAGGQYNHFAPWGDTRIHKWLTEKLPCFGCNWNCPFPTPRCIQEVSPHRITEALNRVIA